MKALTGATKPWYREPWPWLLMAGPAVVVVAGFVTLWLAVVSDDGLVADDYYKQGLAINQVLSREAEARARGYRAQVMFSARQDRVRVALAGERLPAVVRLHLAHPTRAGMDYAVTLPAVRPGVYEGPIAPLAPGRWRLVLEDALSSWQLVGDWRAPGQMELQLAPRQ
ncbi:MAG: FixH family protein [Betaproteobacteria bacterium]|nr:FixH family protein [Betaproteobacteria bacterium]